MPTLWTAFPIYTVVNATPKLTTKRRTLETGLQRILHFLSILLQCPLYNQEPFSYDVILVWLMFRPTKNIPDPPFPVSSKETVKNVERWERLRDIVFKDNKSDFEFTKKCKFSNKEWCGGLLGQIDLQRTRTDSATASKAKKLLRRDFPK